MSTEQTAASHAADQAESPAASQAESHESYANFLILIIPIVLLLAAIVLTVGNMEAATPVQQVSGGDASRGPATLQMYGCGACHTIPGVEGANGKVGPPLVGLSDRGFIAGKLPNMPDNLILWIKDPQGVDPGNAMPNMGVSDVSARDIAAYLYTLR
jgi:cytochrome c